MKHIFPLGQAYAQGLMKVLARKKSGKTRRATSVAGSAWRKRIPKEWVEQIELFSDPLLPGWDLMNVIHEVALREGYTSPAASKVCLPSR